MRGKLQSVVLKGHCKQRLLPEPMRNDADDSTMIVTGVHLPHPVQVHLGNQKKSHFQDPPMLLPSTPIIPLFIRITPELRRITPSIPLGGDVLLRSEDFGLAHQPDTSQSAQPLHFILIIPNTRYIRFIPFAPIARQGFHELVINAFGSWRLRGRTESNGYGSVEVSTADMVEVLRREHKV